MLALWALVITGAVALWRRQRESPPYLWHVLLSGAFLATGIGGGWMAQHIPFYAGYREPQKFATSHSLGLCRLWRFWSRCGFKEAREWSSSKCGLVGAAGVIFIALPFRLRQLCCGVPTDTGPPITRPHWYQANQQLDKDAGIFRYCSLPWHLYFEAAFPQGGSSPIRRPFR